MALVCVLLFAAAWVFGRIALAGSPLERPGRFWLAILTAIAAVAWLLFRHTPLGARHPIAVGTLLHSGIAFGAAMHVGSMGGLDGPYFYVVYALPPLSIGLPARLPARLLITLSGPAVFVATYFGPHPDYLAHPMVHIPAVVLSAVLLSSLVVGHQVSQVIRERFLFGLRIDRQRARLEHEVEDYTAALRDLSGALETLNRDREDVARQLHDDLGQLVLGVRMEIQQLERVLGRLPAAGEAPELDYLSTVVESLDDSVRGFIRRLREPEPPAPLTRSLEELVAPLCEKTGIAIEVAVELGELLPVRVREAVYRLVQEGLTNALKHAEAERVEVRVEDASDGRVLAMVRDDGRGFDPAAAHEGFGLRGLRERAAELGGTLEVDGAPPGTTLRLRVPRRFDEGRAGEGAGAEARLGAMA